LIANVRKNSSLVVRHLRNLQIFPKKQYNQMKG